MYRPERRRKEKQKFVEKATEIGNDNHKYVITKIFTANQRFEQANIA